MAANYDHTAWFYDALSRMVFGSSIRKAQISTLKYIPAHAHVLIAGGGTGWILDEISRIHPSGLTITYVEISENMTALSKQKNVRNNAVQFINKPVEEVKLAFAADVVITPFLFDNFTQQAAEGLFSHLHYQLKPGGIWLYTDFRVKKNWHRLLLKSMYSFFRIFKAVQVNSLPDIDHLINKFGYQIISINTFYGDFIIAKAMQRSV